MVKKLFLIFISLGIYVYFVTTNGEGVLIKIAKSTFNKYLKKMENVTIEMNRIKKD